MIATGGGIVTVSRKPAPVRQNSVCVFLKRDLAKLSADGRPLSLKYGVERSVQSPAAPCTEAWSDLEIDGNQSIEHTVKAIREALKL